MYSQRNSHASNSVEPVCRPRKHLTDAGVHYPFAWKSSTAFRAMRGKNGLPDWPEWCFLPMAAWYAIVSGGGNNRVPLHLLGDVGRLAAIGTWRFTQGIYRFDPTLFNSIIETGVTGDLPCDVLFRLPEWCLYVETPGMQVSDVALHGFFAHLEQDANNGRAELRLLLDTDEALMPFPLHLGPWPLVESVKRMIKESQFQAKLAGTNPVSMNLASSFSAVVEPLVSLLLYICSQNAEIGDGIRVPCNPQPKRTKKGLCLFPPSKPAVWDVGVRLGSALRRGYHTAETSQNCPHSSPRPHIRRAHWHGFRSGPMKRADGSEIPVTEREFTLKWLPPIPVNTHFDEDLPATIRPVCADA